MPYKPLSIPPSYAYLQGTSMAAPQVSGAAVLLFSEKPAASIEEVSDALLSSVDPVPSLAEKTTSGGRLNAARAIAYLEPPAPLLTSTDPASPAEDADPRILGSAVAGTRVQIFSGPECLGWTVEEGSAAELASPGFSVHVPAGSTAQFSAIAETKFNTSPCSTPISYTHSVKDEVAPPAPVLSSTDPVSPARDTHPKIIGSAEAGATIAIYSGSPCKGSPIATGTAAELTSPGIEVAVAKNSVSQLSAKATDSALNTSTCSNSISYLEDEVAPAAPLLLSTSPASPANDWYPWIIGSAETDSSIKVFTGVGCAGGPVETGTASELSSPGITVTVIPGTTAQFSATATDAAENTSPCSAPISYTNTATVDPIPAIIIMPPSPAIDAPTSCAVPKLAGKTLRQAKAALRNAGCTLGKVIGPKTRKGKKLGPLVVKTSNPKPGSSTLGAVSLKLGLKHS